MSGGNSAPTQGSANNGTPFIGPMLTGSGLFLGLCAEENKDHDQVKLGYCRTLTEALSRDSCMVEKLSWLANQPTSPDMQNYCGNYDQLKRDPIKHALFWTQLLAALAVEESGWNSNIAPGDNGSAHGIFQIGQADEGRYGCGCTGLRLYDAHSNIRCGSWIAIKNLSRDYPETIASGSVRDRNAKGIARYFGPFNSHQNNKKDRIMQKTKNWCATRGNQPGTADPEAPAAISSQPVPANNFELIISSSDYK